jgi:hypothetical protein
LASGGATGRPPAGIAFRHHLTNWTVNYSASFVKSQTRLPAQRAAFHIFAFLLNHNPNLNLNLNPPLEISRPCRPAGALKLWGPGFYKDFAPTALGRRPKPGTSLFAGSAAGATSL